MWFLELVPQRAEKIEGLTFPDVSMSCVTDRLLCLNPCVRHNRRPVARSLTSRFYLLMKRRNCHQWELVIWKLPGEFRLEILRSDLQTSQQHFSPLHWWFNKKKLKDIYFESLLNIYSAEEFVGNISALRLTEQTKEKPKTSRRHTSLTHSVTEQLSHIFIVKNTYKNHFWDIQKIGA